MNLFYARSHGNDLPDDKTSENSNTRSSYGKPSGRLLALDLGEKRVGVAISDELWITVRPLPFLRRTSWKQLLGAVADLLHSFDAQALVIGLPLNLDGTEGQAAKEARKLAQNFELSLKVPVHLQDERLTTREAEETLRVAGRSGNDLCKYVDSESAAIILRDFIARPPDL
ncbi:MAG: putative pre6S rRNA nuclease [Acidobacteriota bacterium]|jgi:putative Holliday junction resolvase|nr:putative pre6S rRNA nuclease [Acidobacteriota bacterium]